MQGGGRWDVLVIGGGATGLGVAVDAASRGYRTLLLERGDFGEGTSSRSTKLIHGGVRYLEQGRIGLVRESLRERTLLLENAPALVRPIRFLVPAYSRWERTRVRAGLLLYDALAGSSRQSVEGGDGSRSRGVDAEGARSIWPGLPADALCGGTTYTDAQFDDARLALVLARIVNELGSVACNYVEVIGFSKDESGRVYGVAARDAAIGTRFDLRSHVVIDATGVFSEQTLQLAGFGKARRFRRLALSRGSHLVLGPQFVQSDHALLIPRTEDDRIVFAIPWNGRLLVGTTDVSVEEPSREPTATGEEIDYLLRQVGPYLQPRPRLEDVRSAWAGIRPLVAGKPGAATSRLSREYLVSEEAPGFVSVIGGKWSTYRAMAEEVVDRAAAAGSLPRGVCATRSLRIEDGPGHDPSTCDEPFVRHVVREEMASTVEDVLARRARILFLDARHARELAAPVAGWMAAELGRDAAWTEAQIREMTRLSEIYLPAPPGGRDGR